MGTGQKLPGSMTYKGKLQRPQREGEGWWGEAAVQARNRCWGGRRCPTGVESRLALLSECEQEEPLPKSGGADSTCRLEDEHGAGPCCSLYDMALFQLGKT